MHGAHYHQSGTGKEYKWIHKGFDQIYECQSHKWLLRVHLTFKVNVREENSVLSSQTPRGLCCQQNTGLDGTAGLPSRAVPEFILINGYLGYMNTHLFNRSINEKCSILNRKLNERRCWTLLLM